MKAALTFAYILTYAIYLIFGEDTYFWGGLNIIQQLLFMVILCVFVLQAKKNTQVEELLFEFIIYITFVRILHTILCMLVEEEIWRDYLQGAYTLLLCMGFAVVLIYCATHYKSLK